MWPQTTVIPLGRPLPDAAGRTNDIPVIAPASRPHLSRPANRRGPSSRRGRATQVTSGGGKNRKERRKKKTLWGLPWSSCKANTDFHPSLPVKPVSLDRNTQVLQQVESRTAKLFRAPLKIISHSFISPPSLSLSLSVYLN